MLEEAAENRAHDDVFKNARAWGATRADAAYHHLDPHTGVATQCCAIDDLLINQVHRSWSRMLMPARSAPSTLRPEPPLGAVNDAGSSVRGHQQVAVGQLT